jgi:DNA-binding LacI/PurR family transcriptional regulator
MSTAVLENESKNASGRVQEVAEKLERHIRASELQPGDRYLSAEEGSRLLGESVMTVQRAMALLAKRNVLERRPKAGTFIGPSVTSSETIPCVHFLIPEECINERGAQEEYWEQIQGMRQVLPGLSAQFNFIPNQNAAYARQIVEQAGAAGTLAGVILVLPSRAMRAFFNQSGIPTVVEGSVESDLENLCWFSYDQEQIGNLLAGWLLQRGHMRLATLMRDVWSIGEHLLHDGVSQALGKAGLAADALLVRSTPAEASAIQELVRQTLTHSANPPTGFICRTELQADCVRETARELKLADQVDVAFCGHPQRANKSKYTCAVPTNNAMERGKIVGKMLQTLAQGKMPEPRGYIIPVELSIAPEDDAAKTHRKK